MAYRSVAIGVMLEGVNTSVDDSSPVMFIQGDVVDVTAVGINASLLPWIPVTSDAVSGFGWTANPRNPIAEGSPITVKVRDKNNLLGPTFAEDQGNVVTEIWELDDIFVTRSQTTFRVYGVTAPGSGDFAIYLEGECVNVESVIPLGDGLTYDITVTRGLRGSQARPHQLKPKSYPANENGKDQALRFTSRIDYDQIKIPARIYQFDVTGRTVTGIRTMTYGVVTSRPRPTGAHYTISITPATKSIISHKFGGGRSEVTIGHCLQVTQVSLGSGYGPSTGGTVTATDQLVTVQTSDDVEGQQPKKAQVRLTREEAEYLLGETLHDHTLPWVSLTRVADLADRMAPGMTQSKPFQYQVVVSAGGWSGAFDLKQLTAEQTAYFPAGTDPSVDDIGAITMVKLTMSLAETFEGAISSNPIGVNADGSLTGERLENLNAGWSISDGTAIVPGEEAPKLSLRLILRADFFTACLYLFASDLGDETNPGATEYDVIACGFGLGYDLTRIDVGTVPADAINFDQGTTEFLKLARLVPEKFDYVFTVGGSVGELGPWLKNEALRAQLLWSQEPTTGKMGWRQQNRPSSNVVSLNPVKGTAGIVQPGTRLQSIDAIKVTIGYRGKELTPTDFRIIRLKEVDTAEQVDANQQEIRFWRRGVWTTENLNSGAVPRLTGYYFRQLRGSPTVYKVPLSVVTSARKIGDFVSFTDPNIQTASGRGLTNQVCQVVATDNDLTTGIFWVVLLPHALALINASEGNEAPALKIYHVEEVTAGSVYWLWVDALGTTERKHFNIQTAFGGIYTNWATASASSRVRIVTPSRQNPFGYTERPGWLEAYGRVTELAFNGSVSKLKISFDSSWNRGATIDFRADLLLTDRSYVLFGDRRPATANPENLEIVPIPEVRADGDLPSSSYAPGGSSIPWDQHYYTFIS